MWQSIARYMFARDDAVQSEAGRGVGSDEEAGCRGEVGDLGGEVGRSELAALRAPTCPVVYLVFFADCIELHRA